MIDDQISSIDQKTGSFIPWQSGNGEGLACHFKGGKIFEAGCANYTHTKHAPILREMLDFIPQERQQKEEPFHFSASGLSLIFHPHSPFIPTLHANYRYFEIMDEAQNIVAWYFGGGTDLSPSYLFEEDTVQFHATLKQTCDGIDKNFYCELKKNADDYFYLPHRKEHRGIGGTFAFRLCDRPKELLFKWIEEACKTILAAYLPIVERRAALTYHSSHKKWQLLRRGRYAEFILLCDAGVRFGLNSGIANLNHMFMAMPPQAKWDEDFQIKPNSEEEAMQKVLEQPKEWI
jgi:coproporphyrinogen III oxidase